MPQLLYSMGAQSIRNPLPRTLKPCLVVGSLTGTSPSPIIPIPMLLVPRIPRIPRIPHHPASLVLASPSGASWSSLSARSASIVPSNITISRHVFSTGLISSRYDCYGRQASCIRIVPSFGERFNASRGYSLSGMQTPMTTAVSVFTMAASDYPLVDSYNLVQPQRHGRLETCRSRALPCAGSLVHYGVGM